MIRSTSSHFDRNNTLPPIMEETDTTVKNIRVNNYLPTSDAPLKKSGHIKLDQCNVTNQSSTFGVQAVVDAIKFLDFEKMVKLIQKNPDAVNKKIHCGVTPLHVAVAKNKPKFVKTLIDAKANIYALNVIGHSPVKLAENKKSKLETIAEYDDVERSNNRGILKLLKEREEQLKSGGGDYPENLTAKVEPQNTNERKPDANKEISLMEKKHKMMESLASGEEVSSYIVEELHSEKLLDAKMINGLLAVDFQFSLGCSCSMSLCSAMELALKEDDQELIENILHKSQTLYSDKKVFIGEMLFEWVNRGDEKLVGLLLENSAIDTTNSINYQEHFSGNSALHCAARYCYLITKLLLEHNPDVNIRNKDGLTALDVAQSCQRHQTINILQNHIGNTEALNTIGSVNAPQ